MLQDMVTPQWPGWALQLLSTEWRSGTSASQIASLINRHKLAPGEGPATRKSKNAVISQRARLARNGFDLPNRAQRTGGSGVQRVLRIKAAPLLPKKSGPTPPVPEQDVVGYVGLIPMPRQCRYPIGDPKADGFGFCAASLNHDGPYCGRHYALCYQQGTALRRGKSGLGSLDRAV